jgi:hypothetical protein
MRHRPDAGGNLRDVDTNADTPAGGATDGATDSATDVPADAASPSTDAAHAAPSLLSRAGGMFTGADGAGVRLSSVAVVVVLVAVVGLLGWNWFSSGSADDAVSTAAAGPVLMTEDQLRTVAASAGHSIYWAGPRDLTTYEVTIVGKDVYVRYIPANETAGAKTPYLTVGTYEKTDAYAGQQKAATQAGAKSGKLSGGALVVVPADKPTSAYFAFEGHNLLMEVYDPTPGVALTLVTSGAVNPIQ